MGIRNLQKLSTFFLIYGLYGKPSSKGELTMVLEKPGYPTVMSPLRRSCRGVGLVEATVPYLWDSLLYTSV